VECGKEVAKPVILWGFTYGPSDPDRSYQATGKTLTKFPDINADGDSKISILLGLRGDHFISVHKISDFNPCG
jgi:hypothetical protein